MKALAIERGYKPCEKGWWETEEGARFLKQTTMDQRFDRKVDEELIKEAKRGNIVLDSWTMPWLLKEGFKVWLEASPKVRVGRIAERDGISPERAYGALKEKDEKTKMTYKKEVFQTLCMIVERLLFKKT